MFIIADKEKPCLICGKLTKNIDISEAMICSQECMNKFNKMVFEAETKGEMI